MGTRQFALLLFWVLFNVFALGMLVLDLQVFHRGGRVVRFRGALLGSALYVVLAGAFAILLLHWQGHQASLEFVTGYVLELSLSVDNLFIFLVIFNYFAVPEEQQHRVLFWGIIGALILRGIFIGAGVELIDRFHWLLYLFGALLIYSGFRLFLTGDRQVDPEKNPVVKAARKLIPVTKDYHGGKFFIRLAEENGRRYATPLLIVLLVIETTDVLFAVDSIPAILAITRKAFIVYTSNVFAILGLRSMYFAVAGLMKIFRFLHYGLAVILVFVGVKMVLEDHFDIPITVTLGSVAAVLLIAVGTSIAFPVRENAK
ncbi:MAG TPA: TerC family protein [Candidatus Eisenbacteria bacterium]|nr:TerC family protein [Candidatus Eisenbacteria bacterium]